jgi:hypothetical protein
MSWCQSISAFDLQAVFETVAESSVRLSGADRAFIFRFDGELLRMVVGYNSTPRFVKWAAKNPIRPGGTAVQPALRWSAGQRPQSASQGQGPRGDDRRRMMSESRWPFAHQKATCALLARS